MELTHPTHPLPPTPPPKPLTHPPNPLPPHHTYPPPTPPTHTPHILRYAQVPFQSRALSLCDYFRQQVSTNGSTRRKGPAMLYAARIIIKTPGRLWPLKSIMHPLRKFEEIGTPLPAPSSHRRGTSLSFFQHDSGKRRSAVYVPLAFLDEPRRKLPKSRFNTSFRTRTIRCANCKVHIRRH